MAVSENSIPLSVARRHVLAVFGLAAAAPVASATVAHAAPSAPSPRIALALADLRAADADRRAIEARSLELNAPGICPESEALEEALRQAMDRHYDALEDMTDTTAVTFRDMLAKAEAVRQALFIGAFGCNDPEHTDDGDDHDRLAWSLACDILALAPQPSNGRA